MSGRSCRTAPIRRASGGHPLPVLDNVHRQGAGMVDIDDAILATTTVSPGKIVSVRAKQGRARRCCRSPTQAPRR